MSTMLARWVAAASVLLALLGAACALAAARPVAALPAGPAMVVIAPAPISADDRESEAYADYAEYLNAFAAARPARLKLARISTVRWRRLVRQPALVEDFATVFLRRDGQALVYGGMVVERDVYDAGARWALGGAMPAADMGLERSWLVRR